MTLKEREEDQHQQSLKNFRDWSNVIATSRKEAREKGREEMTLEIARKMKAEGFPSEMISRITSLPLSAIGFL